MSIRCHIEACHAKVAELRNALDVYVEFPVADVFFSYQLVILLGIQDDDSQKRRVWREEAIWTCNGLLGSGVLDPRPSCDDGRRVGHARGERGYRLFLSQEYEKIGEELLGWPLGFTEPASAVAAPLKPLLLQVPL